MRLQPAACRERCIVADGPAIERLIREPNSLRSGGLAVFLARDGAEWKIEITDSTGQAVFVEMSDVDEVIARLAANRRAYERGAHSGGRCQDRAGETR
jgi:hypothetical protein